MGKLEIDNFYCFNGHIHNWIFSQNFLLSRSLRSKQLSLSGCQGYIKCKRKKCYSTVECLITCTLNFPPNQERSKCISRCEFDYSP